MGGWGPMFGTKSQINTFFFDTFPNFKISPQAGLVIWILYGDIRPIIEYSSFFMLHYIPKAHHRGRLQTCLQLSRACYPAAFHRTKRWCIQNGNEWDLCAEWQLGSFPSVASISIVVKLCKKSKFAKETKQLSNNNAAIKQSTAIQYCSLTLSPFVCSGLCVWSRLPP